MTDNEEILMNDEIIVNSPNNIYTRKFNLNTDSWKKLSVMAISHHIDKNGVHLDTITNMTSDLLIEIINYYHDNVYKKTQ